MMEGRVFTQGIKRDIMWRRARSLGL